MAYVKSEKDLWQAYEEQISFLASSCENYDRGNYAEAKRLATIIYTLVRDGGRNSKSLLGQLNKKDSLKYLSSSRKMNDNNLLTESPLVMLSFINGSATYTPIFDQGAAILPYVYLPFSKWWEEPILREKNRQNISRKNLIYSLRNQDGGSHVDSNLTDSAYISITKENGMSWTYVSNGLEQNINGVHLVTMRQIAWELAITLNSITNPFSEKPVPSAAH